MDSSADTSPLFSTMADESEELRTICDSMHLIFLGRHHQAPLPARSNLQRPSISNDKVVYHSKPHRPSQVNNRSDEQSRKRHLAELSRSQLNQAQFQYGFRKIKMISFIIFYIGLALKHLELMKEKASSVDKLRFMILKHWLKNLRIFLLCASRLNKDQRLISLIRRIEEAVRSNPLSSFDPQFSYLKKVVQFRHEAKCLEDEIVKWYIVWSDNDQLQQHSRSSSSSEEVITITDAVLENLEDFLSSSLPGADKEILVELGLALKEEMTFLRNLICFAILHSVDQPLLNGLLTHLETVAVNTGHLSYMFQQNMDDQEWWKQMQSKILVLLQIIKPHDPQISKTYIQALNCLKLSKRPHALTKGMKNYTSPTDILKNFIGSLICKLWKILKLEPFLVLFEKNQLQQLYEGLRFLRTSLRDQALKFDEKLMDLTSTVTCQAGQVIFWHSQENGKTDLEFCDLLKRIMLIRVQVENVPEKSRFDHPRANELGFVDSLLENLVELTRYNANLDIPSWVRTIQEQIIFLRSFMGEIVEIRSEQEKLQTLWTRVVQVAYRVELLIDTKKLGDIPNSFPTSFDSFVEDMANVITEVLKISHGNKGDTKVKKVAGRSNQIPLQSSAQMSAEVVGFDEETISITDRLTRGSKYLQVVAIVGMPGIGKTTLATKVYDDPSVMSHFHIRARCSVSQVLDKKKMLHELLNGIVPQHSDRYFEMTEQDLIEDLWRRLRGNRYLIFLDDVWDMEAWNSLERSLPDDANGSRIILTSRHCGVAPLAKLGEGPHFLRLLTAVESWKLLQMKLFLGNDSPPELYELGMQIAENCKGLPLTIIIVAGLLATMKQKDWMSVSEILHSGNISSTGQCTNTLDLSYKHLPDYLKPCFLYFGAFPEDHEISVKRLIQLWIAEGFVRRTNLKSPEDVAMDYMMDLISRSLVMVANQKSIGGVKTCRVHDLIHDFCSTKAKEENFFLLLKGYKELSSCNEPCHLWRLCIYSKPKHFKESKLFCPRARSLLFFSQTERYERIGFEISFVIHIFKSLRVLDLSQIHLGLIFPSEMELLIQLRYLAVQGEMNFIPSSIGKLSNLETFVVNSLGRKVSLPDSLWNLQKLRHLYIRMGAFHHTGFSLPFLNLDRSSSLHELNSFSGAIISSWHCMAKQLRKFPNIRRLKCQIFEYGDNSENFSKIVVFDFLSRLESLDLSPFGLLQNHVKLECDFPANLRKLTLSCFELSSETISTIGKLRNLEALKLLNASFPGARWDVEEGDFSRLRFLKMAALNMVSWTADYDQFPCLEKLTLERCKKVKEFPSCLENSSTLQMIEVRYCSLSLANIVKQIQEEQMKMGNLDLKVLFNP